MTPEEIEKAAQEKAEQYKIEQQKRIGSYMVGAKDQSGFTILRIYGRGDEYVVYEVETRNVADSLKVLIDTVVEENNTPINNYIAIKQKVIIVKSLLYKCVDKSTIMATISHTIITAIEGQVDAANQHLEDLIKEINKEYEDQFKNRMRLLISSLILSVILIGVGLSIYLSDLLLEYPHLRNLFYTTAGGSIGGFFSISIGINKIVCEKDVAKWLYVLYGFERIIISILAAAIAYFAIQTNLVFGLAKNLPNPTIGYIFFAILAGFSETLIPNILTKVEKQV